MQNTEKKQISAIIGLGNPGPKFARTRHNIGFMIVDALADAHGAQWQSKELMHITTIMVNNKPIILIKPQTYMNSSGKVIPFLTKKGIKPEETMVVHDELELPFGKTKIRHSGSAKGHNGLKSIIEQCGDKFMRFCFGIGRPLLKEQVPDYVLDQFVEGADELARLIAQAVNTLEELV